MPSETDPNGKNLIRAISNKNLRSPFAAEWIPSGFSKEIGETARAFHSTFPQYYPTPMVRLNILAEHLGVSRILVKDESHRFGLNSFKVLGGSFAIGKLISQKLELDIEKVNFEYLKSREVKDRLGLLTFTTASDGNHGRGVAWTARQLGHKAIVFLPHGTVEKRIEAIKETVAETYITEFNYDETVRYASEMACKNKWELIQDTAWEGYTQIPKWIMQGYTTMMYEALDQMKAIGLEKPSHLFLQAGVGSMAGAVLGCFLDQFGESYPITAIIEPNEAACYFDSVDVGNGQPHPAKGSLKTIMAGLSCGVPNPIAWEILRNFSDMMISCPDYVAAKGMRILANPLDDDPKVVSGESGAVGIGLLFMIMKDTRYIEIKRELGLKKDSIIFLINTEGDTDPENYRRIIRNGKLPTPE